MIRNDASMAALVLTLLLLACGGSGAKHKCVAATDWGGDVRYSSIGTGSSTTEARSNAVEGTCIVYCENDDPTVVKAYEAWKATPDGQKSKAGRSFEIGLNLKAERTACEDKCNALTKAGGLAVKTECL